MTKARHMKHDLTRLERVLDTYGADPARWPGAERDGLGALVKVNADARRLVVEAKALERVMDSATVSPASDALKARIVSAAVGDTSRSARVVPINAGANRSGALRSARTGVTVIWPAAALAASFALGIYLGVTGIGERALPVALQIAAIPSPLSDGDVIPWIEESIGPDSEDLL